ncbi:MAG: flotillin-like FloA family protein [Pirellulaceae bacterium]
MNAMDLFVQNTLNAGQTIVIALVVIALIVVLVLLSIFMSYFRWWIQSFLTGAGISIFDLIGMTFRKVKPSVIVQQDHGRSSGIE